MYHKNRIFEVEIVLLRTLRVKRNVGRGTPTKYPFLDPKKSLQNVNSSHPADSSYLSVPTFSYSSGIPVTP